MQIRYNEDKHAKLREVAKGLFMTLPGIGKFEGMPLLGAFYDVEMTVDMTDEGIRATAVKVTAQQGSPPVTGTILRAVRVWDALREVIVLGTRPGSRHERGVLVRVEGLSEEKLVALRQQGPTDETLEWVAYFYKLGGVLGLPPAKQVELSFEIPRTTASKWVRRAREKGLIDGKH